MINANFRFTVGLVVVNVAFLLMSQTAIAVPCNGQTLPICTWIGDDDGFWPVIYSGRIIDFETLPNGQPSVGGVFITPSNNYTAQGVFFQAQYPHPYISGNATFGYNLTAFTGSVTVHDWITAELVNPQEGVGIYFRGGNTLRVYNAQGGLIASVSYPSNPGTVQFFLGVRSDVPIVRAEIDSGGESAELSRFDMIHIPVPEPASAALLLFGIPILFRRSTRMRGR